MKKLVILLFLNLILLSLIATSLAIAESDYDTSEEIGRNREENSGEEIVGQIRERIEGKVEENRGEIERRIEQRGAEIREKVKERIENEDERKEIKRKFRERIRENGGIIEIEGRNISIRDINESEKEIIIGRIKAKIRADLFEENETGRGQILRAILSNGEFANIRIMPDRAAAIALGILKAKCDENNCTMELKEVGKGNKIELRYELETEKEGRLLFLLKIKMKVRAEIDSETGEVISIKRPWWRFLFFVKEKDEDVDEIENELEENETDREDKVTLCHIPPGNENAAHTIVVGEPAVRAHLAHGDYLGACKSAGGNQTNGNQTTPGNQTGNETQTNSTTVNIVAAVGVGSTS